MKMPRRRRVCQALCLVIVPLLMYRLSLVTTFNALTTVSVMQTALSEYRCSDEKFIKELTRRARPRDRLIILALVDSAFVDMAINLYETSFKPFQITNFLFVGVGQRACEQLLNASLPCYHYTNDSASDMANTYMSPEFIRKMNIRTDMIIDALSVGFTVLHTDLDIVFLTNPLPDLEVATRSADIATMWDSSAHNAGFLVVQPTVLGREIYARVKKMTNSSATLDDQSALNTVINKMKWRYARGEFNVVTLNSSRYLCGLDYFEEGNRLFPTAIDCPDCLVVHNNWIVSRETKTYRFREHLMWNHDKDAYYSSSSARYLVYDNPVTWPDDDTSVTEELAALKSALALGEVLDRIVILPRFHCFAGGSLIGSRWWFLKSVPNEFCPLNSLLNISAFDAVFADFYRESSFLHHHLVPDDVKSSQSPTYLIVTETNKDLVLSLTNKRTTLLTIEDTVLTSIHVDRFLSTVTPKVLAFGALYRTVPEFETLQDFQIKITNAFQRASYRQLSKATSPSCFEFFTVITLSVMALLS